MDRGYKDPQSFPDKKERDHHDETSTHFIVRSIESNEWLAALRLITVPFDVLPMSRIYKVYDDQLPEFGKGLVAEASRLCAITPQQKLHFAAGAAMPWISMGLIRAARVFCLENNIRYCFFLIKDSLARILKRVRMEFIPVGPVSSYRGKRRPYIHNVQLG